MSLAAKKSHRKKRNQLATKSRAFNQKRLQSNRKLKPYKVDREKNHQRRVRIKLNKEVDRVKMFSRDLNDTFSLKTIEKIAKSTKYLVRKSKLTPIAFLITMCCGQFGNGKISLSLLTSNLTSWFGINVTPKAISERLGKRETVKYFREMLKVTINSVSKLAFRNKYTEIFKFFSEVRIEDSTIITLYEQKGIKKLKGFGGGASKSALKINYSYDITGQSAPDVNLVSGIIPDQTLAKMNIQKLKKGALIIRDLGYLNLNALIQIMKNAFFLSRASKQAAIFLKIDDLEPVDTNQFLAEKLADQDELDILVFIGEKHKLPVRLIAQKVPDEVKALRTKRYKKERKKAATEDYIIWSGFSVFITNIPKDVFSPTILILIYKIRWQIELLFKTMKSTLKIHVIRAESDNSVSCMIYAKLISIVMASSVISYAKSICEEGNEISSDKTMKWLQNENRFGKALRTEGIEKLLNEMIVILHMLYMDRKNTEKSTYNTIREALEREEMLQRNRWIA